MEPTSLVDGDKDEKLLKCAFCDHMSVDICTLPCLHSACKTCLEKEFGKKSCQETICPVCKYVCIFTQANPLQVNRHISAMIKVHEEARKESVCKFCLELADHICLSRCGVLCRGCFDQHNKFQKDHRVIEIETYRTFGSGEVPPASIVFCQLHNQELSFFCDECSATLCRECAVNCERTGHFMRMVENYSGEVRAEVQKQLQDLLNGKQNVVDQASSNRKQVENLAFLRTNLQRTLEANKIKVLNIVERKFGDANAAVVKHVDSSIDKASEELSVAEGVKSAIDHVAFVCQYLLDFGGDVSIIDQHKMILRRIEEIKRQLVSQPRAVISDDTLAIESEKFENAAADIMGKIVGRPISGSDSKRAEATFVHEVNNISTLEGSSFSPSVEVRSIVWRIEVSISKEAEKFLSVHLQGKVTDRTSWSCNAAYELRLISRNGGRDHVSKSQDLFTSDRRWGFTNFISWSQLFATEMEYVKDDSIIVQARLHADAPHGIRSDSVSLFEERELLLSRLETVNQLINALPPDTEMSESSPCEEWVEDEHALEIKNAIEIQRVRSDSSSVKGVIRYRVPGITKLLKGITYSPVYVTRDMRWYLHVEPSKGQGRPAVDICVTCNPTQRSPSWSCKTACELRLITHTGGDGTICTKQHDFTHDEPSCEFPALITYADLVKEENGYVDDDSAVLQVTITFIC